MAGLDYKNKKVIIAEPYSISGDPTKDFKYFHNFFKDMQAKNPVKFEPNFYKNIVD